MKYCVTLIQNESTCAAYLFDTKSAAKARFHHEMEYANTEDVTTVCMVTDTNGGIIASDKHTAIPDPVEGGDGE